MRAPAPTFSTDRQRLARAGRPQPLAPAGDKAKLARPAGRQAPTPLAVKHDTWVIRGKDGTYLGLAFGDGRKAHQIDLYDHLSADYVPHLGNYILNLTGIVPDAIGLDIGASMGAGPMNGMIGLNVIFHTRGEGKDMLYPEIHVYYGGSGGLTVGSLFTSFLNPPNVAASVQVILAWARRYDTKGRGYPASDSWVANGFNWTGTFWGASFSVPLPPRFTLVGSYFRSSFALRDVTYWHGVSVGVGVSGKLKIKAPVVELDLSAILSFKKPTVSWTQTEYGLVYGNGHDFIPATKTRAQQSIDGLHAPINQNDY